MMMAQAVFALRSTGCLLPPDPTSSSAQGTAMVGGAWGGVVIRWGVGYAFHGYCFGYCVYVLAVKPIFITARLALHDQFPSLKDSH
mmetsp:Transcript_182547/g.578443  ORF Transcript_182547/g.578443 Transcript_182547/m.578443 type:complete len:86 (+) Transcript_182547:56-313(+)